MINIINFMKLLMQDNNNQKHTVNQNDKFTIFKLMKRIIF